MLKRLLLAVGILSASSAFAADMRYVSCTCSAVFGDPDSCQMLGVRPDTGAFDSEVKAKPRQGACDMSLCGQMFMREWQPKCARFSPGPATWSDQGKKFTLCSCGQSPDDAGACRMSAFERATGELATEDLARPAAHTQCSDGACGEMFFANYREQCETYVPGAPSLAQ